jgi:hypothetical protein
MRTVQYDPDKLRHLFVKKKVLTLDAIKESLGTPVKMTVFRKLKSLSYRASYSHAGKYYTLDDIATYDHNGLWSFNRIHFSINGSLINTINYLINLSAEGYFASELNKLLMVRVHEPLLKLYNSQKVRRRQIGGQYLYLSIGKWQKQFAKRKKTIEARVEYENLYLVSGFDSAETRHCLKLFLSTLNEKQRRLYVGFESMKLGRGGDKLMSKITGINVKTIGRGRKELVCHDITPQRIRKPGAGRPSLKKTLSCSKS